MDKTIIEKQKNLALQRLEKLGDKDEFRDEIGRFKKIEIKILENGPVRGVIRIKYGYNKSVLWQDFTCLGWKTDVLV